MNSYNLWSSASLTKRYHVPLQVHSAVKFPCSAVVDRHVGRSTLLRSWLNSDWANVESAGAFSILSTQGKGSMSLALSRFKIHKVGPRRAATELPFFSPSGGERQVLFVFLLPFLVIIKGNRRLPVLDKTVIQSSLGSFKRDHDVKVHPGLKQNKLIFRIKIRASVKYWAGSLVQVGSESRSSPPLTFSGAATPQAANWPSRALV